MDGRTFKNVMMVWMYLALGIFVIEVINLYFSSRCGLIEMSCPYNMVFPKAFYIVFIVIGFIFISMFLGHALNRKEGVN